MPRFSDKFDELANQSLPDVIDYNLDILFVNANQHHYSGQGNQFFRCLQESELTNRLIKPSETAKLLDFRYGLVNMAEKPAERKNSEMAPEEQRKAQEILRQKILLYKPKIIAYNGKPSYEVYIGAQVNFDFNYGKQPTTFEGTNILQFCLPSTSARLSILPTVTDKVPFFAALKKLKDYLNGRVDSILDDDIIFPDFKITVARDINESQNEESEQDEDISMREDNDDSKPKKTFRMNNLSLSQIPAQIYEQVLAQKKIKKSVTIETSKEYLNMFKRTPKLLSVCAPGSTCSDPDTQSNLTNDSDYEKPMTPNNEKIMAIINQAKLKSVAKLNESSKKINALLNEAGKAPLKPITKIQVPKMINSPVSQAQVKQPIVVIQNKVELVKETVPVTFPTIELELVKRDQYRYDDYFRYENTQQNAHNLHYLLSDDYYQNLKQDLNRKLKFCFDDDDCGDMYDETESRLAFTNVAEASSYVLTSANGAKRSRCFVNVNNL